MVKSLKYIVASFGLLTCVAGFRVSAQSLETWKSDGVHSYIFGTELFRLDAPISGRRVTAGCAYIDWLNRPKRAGVFDALLGPIGQVKNGPYAAWNTKIAYLTVTGSMKFQSSPLVKDTWRLYSSTYDRYDFILGQEARKDVTFRLSGSYSMNGMKVFDTDKIAHCYNVAIKPEAVLNSIRWQGKGASAVTLSALAGPELGVLFSIDNWILQARFYAGVTSAVRFDYSIADRFCLYFEPRLSYVPYTLRNLIGNRPSTSVNRFGSIARLNMGLRVSF